MSTKAHGDTVPTEDQTPGDQVPGKRPSPTTPSVQDNGEITTLRKKLKDAEKRVKELEVQYVQAKSKATEQQDAKEQAEGQRSVLRFKINEIETKLKRTQEDYKEASTSAENKYKELEKCLNEKERQITELKKENKDIKEDAEKRVKELEVQYVQAKSKATEQQDAKEKAEGQRSVLRFKINEIETKLKRTQEDYKEASTSAENKYKELEKCLNEKERQITELKKENKDIKALKEKYEKQADDKANERVSASAKEDRTRSQEKLNEKDAELKRVQSKLDELQSLTNETFKKKDETMRKLQDDLKTAREELNKIRDSITNLKHERTKLQDDLKKTTLQKDALSKVVGAKTSEDNPNINDLSDENRPTKLSEKYSALYDNEWTDAYRAIESDEPSEIRAIERLYSALIEVNQFCKETSVKYTENIMKSVMTLNGGHIKDTQIDVSRRRQLNDLKKTFAPDVTRDVLDRFKRTGKCAAKLEKFYTKCVEICWLMSVQDPPVVIDTNDGKGGAFNGDRYRTYRYMYTKTGKIMEYVVWPPLLLHNGGPLLTKGVAQAK